MAPAREAEPLQKYPAVQEGESLVMRPCAIQTPVSLGRGYTERMEPRAPKEGPRSLGRMLQAASDSHDIYFPPAPQALMLRRA